LTGQRVGYKAANVRPVEHFIRLLPGVHPGRILLGDDVLDLLVNAAELRVIPNRGKAFIDQGVYIGIGVESAIATGKTSYSIFIARAASSANVSVSAATAATASPILRTLSDRT